MGIGIVNDEFHCQPKKQPFFNQLSIPAHKKTVLKYLSTPTHFSYQIYPFIAIDLGYISIHNCPKLYKHTYHALRNPPSAGPLGSDPPGHNPRQPHPRSHHHGRHFHPFGSRGRRLPSRRRHLEQRHSYQSQRKTAKYHHYRGSSAAGSVGSYRPV